MSEPQASEGADSPPRSRRQKLAAVAAGLFFLYVAVGYLVVPSIVESQVVGVIEEQTGTRPSLESVSFDPFGWRLELHGFAMADPAGGADAIAFTTFAADVSILDLLVANLALEEVVLVEPEISAVVDEEGNLNFLAFVPEPSPPEPESEAEEPGDEGGGLPVIEVDVIRIEQGDLRFEDRSQAPVFEVAVAPLDLEMEGFTTRAGGASPYAISIHIGSDTELRWSGTLGLDPVRSEGKLALERFDLRLPWDYLSDRLAFEVEGGHLAVSARYQLDLSEGLALAIDDARIGIQDARILDPELEEPVVVVPALDVSGVALRVDPQGLASVVVGEVSLEEARIRSHVTEEGEVHLATLFTPAADGTEADPAPGPEAEAPPRRRDCGRPRAVDLRGPGDAACPRHRDRGPQRGASRRALAGPPRPRGHGLFDGARDGACAPIRDRCRRVRAARDRRPDYPRAPGDEAGDRAPGSRPRRLPALSRGRREARRPECRALCEARGRRSVDGGTRERGRSQLRGVSSWTIC